MDSNGDNSPQAHKSNAVPNKPTIAAALKSTVQKLFKQDPELVTVGAARTQVEEELGLELGFLKKDGYWNKEAKAVVKNEFKTLSEAPEEEKEPTPKKKPTAKKPTAKKVTARPVAKKAAAKQSKPTDEDTAIGEDEEEEAPKKAPAKRGRPSTKKAKPTEEDKDVAIEADESPKKASAKRGRPAAAKNPTPKKSRGKPTIGEGEDSDVPAEPSGPAPAPALVPTTAATPDSESELSDVLDEPPKSAKRSKPNNSITKKPTQKRTQAKATVKDDEGEEDVAPPPPPAAAGSDSELSEVSDEPPKTKNGKRSFSAKSDAPKKKVKASPAKVKPESKEELGKDLGNDRGAIQQDRPTTPDAGSESEMSVVLDPTPQKGRSSNATKKSRAPKKTKSPKVPAARKGKAKKPDAKPDTNLDPEQEQLKSLKAWLLKCGIRRIWARELAKFETPRAQIAHLKGLLTEVGMTGRYSAEKAKKIKEERELRAEVEAVQAGAGVWGMEEKKEEVGRQRRSVGRRGRATVEDDEEDEEEVAEKQERINRGREDLAFLDGQSESE